MTCKCVIVRLALVAGIDTWFDVRLVRESREKALKLQGWMPRSQEMTD